ncbi:MAG: pyridoxamine 5'-phosphate oxidase family protein, partial [Cyanobacteria bacterium P01_C01_bin.72]
LSDRSIGITAKILPGDPLATTLAAGIDIGLLGIELSNRRRNRLNGVVSLKNGDRFEVRVGQSFGNCPQYIQARKYEFKQPDAQTSKPVQEIRGFSDLAQVIVASSDTFFIATAYQNSDAGTAKGVDVSHRGGKLGFVRIDSERTLTVPDFSGNCLFNTFGNLEVNPKAGLLFTDFQTGNLLYLTGTAEVIWSGVEISQYAGAERLLRFYLDQGFLVENSLPLRWSSPEFSPRLKNTGAW